MHLLKKHYVQHVANCACEAATGNGGFRAAGADHDGDEVKTHDGYRIDRCWECGHRVCLVPDGHGGVRVFDIARNRMRGDRHMCDGAKPEGRRSKLTYVNSRVGSIAPPDNAHRPHKL